MGRLGPFLSHPERQLLPIEQWAVSGMFPDKESTMKTPFYVVKRTPVTKETAMEKWHELKENYDSLDTNASDLVDFCLSGGVEEKVYIEAGIQVRIKSMPGHAFFYPTPGEGVACRVSEVTFVASDLAHIALTTEDDYNRLTVSSEDLSEYLELV